MKINSKKIALNGIFAGLSTIVFTLENLFPPIILPGAKMGLSNVFILLSLFVLGWQYGLITLVIKTTLGSLFAGNISAMMYSLPSGLIALTVEILLFYFATRTGFSAISIVGSVINTTIQNVIFCLVTNTTEYLYYTPYLALIGVVSGLIVGIIVFLIVKYIPEKVFMTYREN